MRAVVCSRYGPPSVLRLRDRPKPVAEPNQLLIRVGATTVNRTDTATLRGRPAFARLFTGLTKPKRSVLGSEFAGRIDAVGAGVVSFDVGDRVFGFDGLNFGAHADFLTVRETGLVARIPAGLSFEEAAPSTEGAHYALNLIKAARVTTGQKVLVNGATGAIGSAAVQLLSHFGAEVTAVCGTVDVPLVLSLGANRVIDYTREDFTALPDRFDVVVDAVGKSSFGRCAPILKPGGLFLSTDLGFLGQNPLLAVTTRLFGTKKVLFPIPWERQEDIILLADLMETGRFRAVIDRSYPLEAIVEAFEYVESGAKVGNVVIRVADGD